jgi:hypothetical protein
MPQARTSKKTAKKQAKKKAPRPVGRPTKLTPAVAAAIIGRLMQPESLASICRDEKTPSKQTVMNWLDKGTQYRSDPEKHSELKIYSEFLDRYTRARIVQQELHIDECIDIADDGTNDYVERETKRGVMVVLDKEAVMRSRLRVDTRIRVAEKMAPKKYGPKADITSDGRALPQQVSIIVSPG